MDKIEIKSCHQYIPSPLREPRLKRPVLGSRRVLFEKLRGGMLLMTSSHMSWRIVQSCCHAWVKTILKLLLNFLEFPSFQSKQERKEIIYPVGKLGSLTF